MTTTRTQLRWRAYRSADGDTTPVAGDYVSYLNPLSITHRAGGVVECALEVDLGRANLHLENLSLEESVNQQLEVWSVDAEGAQDDRLFWGEVLTQQIRITADGEFSSLLARVIPQHYHDEPLKGQLIYDANDDDLDYADYDLEFNPEIDGEFVFNMFPSARANNPRDYPIWIDPDSTRSQTALDEVHGDGTSGSGDNAEWTLNDIVETLCWLCNDAETLIDNPTRAEIDAVITSPPAVRNLVLPRGLFLPDYLNAVLPRYGYNWFLDVSVSGNPKITIFKRGDGTEKELKLQARGENIDLTQSDCDDFDLTVDIASVTNRIHIQGGLMEREVTLDLHRAWDSADDSTGDDADNDNIVWRKWVANEGGDYIGLRTEIPTSPPDFGVGFLAPKKRVLHDCLTLRDGKRRPFKLEYSEDDGSTWTDAAAQDPDDATIGLSTHFNLLQDEIGVYFTGELDERLKETDNTLFRMRITGTIIGDERIEHRTAKSTDSPTSRQMERYVDASDQFHDRQRLSGGTDYDSVLTGDADTRDDSTAIEAFADDLLDQELAAQLTASLRVAGFSLAYGISDLLTKLAGREISLNRKTSGAASPAYLQVIGYTLVNQPNNRSTQLQVEPYDT